VVGQIVLPRDRGGPAAASYQLSGALAIIIEALETDMSDVLSPIFSEITAASSLGQFFTPYSLSLVCAQKCVAKCVAKCACNVVGGTRTGEEFSAHV
jgi:hypothetical protein